MANRPPVLLADGYVNAGLDASLRVFNVFNGVTKVQLKSGVFEGGLEQAYDLEIVDDEASSTGKSAVGNVPIATDIEPDRYDATIVFPEWGVEVKNQSVLVDSTTATDPMFAELVPGMEHEGQRMYNLRVSPVSANLSTADAATDIPGNDLEFWFGLVGDKHSGLLHQNLTTPLPIQPGEYTVKVRQRFHNYADESTWITKEAKVVLKGDDNDVKPGQGSFVVTKLLDPNKMGTKSIIKHSVSFGDDHEQSNTRYGVSPELVVTSHTGGEPDLPDDVIKALRDLQPFTINRHTDRVVLTSGNPPLLRGNHNFKIKYVVTIIPVPDEDAANSDDFQAAS